MANDVEIAGLCTAILIMDAYDLRKTTPHQTDLARMKAGQLGGQFWSVYVPGEVKDSGYARIQLEQIDIARRIIQKYPERLVAASTAADMRAAFKAVMGGKQVAMLAPTTVLSQQHYQNLRERFSDYPIKVEVLNRFRSAAESKKVVAALAARYQRPRPAQ